MNTMFDRHKFAALHFSGGKDSLACLYLLKPYWDRIVVMWANTGNAFPETLAQMEKIKAMVPHFMEVKSDQPAEVKEFGPPSDLLAWWDTDIGRMIYPARTGRMQSPAQCCGANIWKPIEDATARLGATLVIRGQRNSEDRRGPIRSGHVHNGVEYWFPIEDWSREQLRQYLTDNDIELPAHYNYVDSSLDCMTCTAYLDENEGKFTYMRKFHPELHGEVTATLRGMRATVMAEMQHLDKALLG